MSDQVPIVVRRRLPDGTWPPGEEPPEYRLLLVGLVDERDGVRGTRCDAGIIKNDAFFYGKLTLATTDRVIAWADVTDVFAGGREAKQ